MPLRHVALYRWAEPLDDEHLERLSTALGELRTAVPGVRNVTHGPDVGLTGGSFDHIVVVDVDTVRDWQALRDHPAYILLTEELITPFAVAQADGQFRVDDPAAMASPADTAVVGDADLQELTDDELMERARRAAQASMDALMAEPDDI